jgi:hypothetical protein
MRSKRSHYYDDHGGYFSLARSRYNDHVNQKDADPELLRQLLEAEAIEEDVQVVFSLRLPPSGKKPLSPDETETLTRSILQRVEKAFGCPPHDLNIFRNLGQFVIQAPAGFLRMLMVQEEIASAVANRQPRGGISVPPHKKRPL